MCCEVGIFSHDGLSGILLQISGIQLDPCEWKSIKSVSFAHIRVFIINLHLMVVFEQLVLYMGLFCVPER